MPLTSHSRERPHQLAYVKPRTGARERHPAARIGARERRPPPASERVGGIPLRPLRPVTLLELLTAPAPARVVAPDLLALIHATLLDVG